MSDEMLSRSEEKVRKRRGIFAGALALVAAVVTRFTEERTVAANGDPLLLGAANQANSSTLISGANPLVFGVESEEVRNGAGILGVSNHGDSHRVVGVAALHLSRFPGAYPV